MSPSFPVQTLYRHPILHSGPQKQRSQNFLKTMVQRPPLSQTRPCMRKGGGGTVGAPNQSRLWLCRRPVTAHRSTMSMPSPPLLAQCTGVPWDTLGTACVAVGPNRALAVDPSFDSLAPQEEQSGLCLTTGGGGGSNEKGTHPLFGQRHSSWPTPMGGGFGTRPRYLIVCLWRRLLAYCHCSF